MTVKVYRFNSIHDPAVVSERFRRKCDNFNLQ